MGPARLPGPRGLGCFVLVLLLLLGGSGSPGTTPPPRAPWAEEQGAVPEGAPWGRVRYEAVKKHLGALSKHYWQYLACKMWQEGCEEEEKQQGEREASPIPGKRLALFSPVPRREQQVRILLWPRLLGRCPFFPRWLPRASPSLAHPGMRLLHFLGTRSYLEPAAANSELVVPPHSQGCPQGHG